MVFEIDSFALYNETAFCPFGGFNSRTIARICLSPCTDAEAASVTLHREWEEPFKARCRRKVEKGDEGPVFEVSVSMTEFKPHSGSLVTVRVKIKNMKMARFHFEKNKGQEEEEQDSDGDADDKDVKVTWKSLIDDTRNNEHHEIGQDISKGYRQDKFHDFTIVCQNRQFPCHKFILASRSEVLGMILSNNSAETQKGELCIKDSDPEAVELFLSHLYGDKIKKKLSEVDLVSRLLQLAEKYAVAGLSQMCSSLLMEKINAENASDILGMARMYKIDHLEERAKAFVTRKARQVVGTASWKDLVGSDPEVAGEIIYRLLDND